MFEICKLYLNLSLDFVHHDMYDGAHECYTDQDQGLVTHLNHSQNIFDF